MNPFQAVICGGLAILFPMKHGNIFSFGGADDSGKPEFFETLLKFSGTGRVERIYSEPYSDGQWYDQDEDEFVLLLSGESVLEFADSSKLELGAGDWLVIDRRTAHRVVRTSDNPRCVWLTVFGDFSEKSANL